MAELVVGLPDGRRPVLVGGEARRPGWGWFTGWFNLARPGRVVASVDYAAATFLATLLSLYEVDILGA